MDYNFKEEHKKISDNYYIVRCCEVSKIENYISEMEKKKKNESNSSRYKRLMSLNQKKNTIHQNNFRNPEPNMNNFFGQNQRPNNIQSIKMSLNQNQNNFNNNNFNNNNFQNFQMPMNFMNMTSI
jgi:hypothetical protein